MVRAGYQCVVFYSASFLPLLSFLSISVSFRVSSTALVSIPLPFPFSSCVRSLVSAPNPVITSGRPHTKLDLSLTPFAL